MITDSEIKELRYSFGVERQNYLIDICDRALKGDKPCRLQLERFILARGHETIPSATQREQYRCLVPPPRRDD